MKKQQIIIPPSKNLVERRFLPFFGLLLFSFILLVLDEYLTGWMQTRHIMWMTQNEYRHDRQLLAGFSFILSFSIWVIYCWACFRAVKPVRVVLWLFCILSIFIEYGYIDTFHRWMTSVDLWTAFLSPWTLWTEAIGMYINYRALIIITVFSLAAAINWKRPRSSNLPEIILLVCLIGTWVFRTYMPFDRVLGISVFQYARLLEDIRPADRAFGHRAEVPSISTTVPNNNIILVIDESLRGDHLSINGYDRDTTPSLQELNKKGLITNWGIAAAGATCSINSNPHILTGVPSSPGADARLTSNWPTVFQFARAMGYRTYYLDAQESYLWNGLLAGDLNFVDVYLTTQEFGKSNNSDQQAASYIRKQVVSSTGNFIVLNKMGMHILYENNYPPSEAHWQPTPPDRDYKKNPSLVINAYDNAVHFNLESFFKTLMPDMEPLPQTVLLYTSDHGQTLQEHGETWSHCHNSAPEANVPLFILGRINPVPDTQYHASHMNILPTLLDLMDVPQEFRKEQYAPSLFVAESAMNQPRFFLDGDLMPVQFNSQ